MPAEGGLFGIRHRVNAMTPQLISPEGCNPFARVLYSLSPPFGGCAESCISWLLVTGLAEISSPLLFDVFIQG